MPMYEFECRKCGLKGEKVVPMDTKFIECGSCGGQSIKVVSRTAPPRFRGRDWTPKFHK